MFITPRRHITIAQDLVMAARGKLVDRNWKRNAGGVSADGTQQTAAATIDDISVLVVPILAYKKEYAEWKVASAERRKARWG